MSICLALVRGQEVSVRVTTPPQAPNIQQQLFFSTWRQDVSEQALTFCMFCFLLSLQVTVKMYKRGSQGWLGKSLNATATIPSNTSVIFRISGEEADAKIPANTIHSITLSNWHKRIASTTWHCGCMQMQKNQTLNLAQTFLLSAFYYAVFVFYYIVLRTYECL